MSKLLLYDEETGESLWLVTTTPGTSEPASFGYLEGQGFVPSPVIYLGPNGSSTVDNSNSSLTPSTGSGEGRGKWAFYNMPGEYYSGPKSLLYTGTWSYYQSHRGGGGPSVTASTSTAASKRSPESRKAFKTNSAHGFRKTKGVSARGKCPKGHYWSYKKKKCVKSKFR